MIYLYAITEPSTPAPAGPGLDDQPLEVLRAGELAALVSRHDRGGFEPDPENLWCHDRVVERAMRDGAVLPARFASTFPDAEALTDALRRDQAELRAAMDGVRGCVELAVRVSLPAPDRPAPRDGREYVATKLRSDQASRLAAEETLEPLAAHAVRSRRGAPAGDSGTLTASYLVRAGDVPRFTERVRQLAQANAELSLSCTGPWPPYSFVGQETP
jgi:Gas vesicle synthesis protein GvpL/GvpF